MEIEDFRKKQIADFIQGELGIVYDRDNEFQLDVRIDKAVKSLHLSSLDELHSKIVIEKQWQARQMILSLSINNETSFFRDAKVFQGLKERILPELIKSMTGTDPVRIWCAAASFGQEPYTLSMILKEAKEKGRLGDYSLDATDVSPEALERAKAGLYTQLEVQRGLSALQLVKYFEKTEDNHWKIKSELKENIHFNKYNLMDGIPFMYSFHIVFCRNVLIYQTSDGKKEIIERIRQKINPGGYLVLGATESLIGLSSGFEQVVHEGAVFYQKRG